MRNHRKHHPDEAGDRRKRQRFPSQPNHVHTLWRTCCLFVLILVLFRAVKGWGDKASNRMSHDLGTSQYRSVQRRFEFLQRFLREALSIYGTIRRCGRCPILRNLERTGDNSRCRVVPDEGRHTSTRPQGARAPREDRRRSMGQSGERKVNEAITLAEQLFRPAISSVPIVGERLRDVIMVK